MARKDLEYNNSIVSKTTIIFLFWKEKMLGKKCYLRALHAQKNH